MTANARLLATAGLLVGLAGAATLAGAWYFQLVVGLAPCPLCLEQRLPYYAAVPMALLAAVLARIGLVRTARLLMLVAGLLLLAGAAMGVYHSGVEWGFWPGPDTCSGGGPVQGGNLLTDLNNARVVRCDEAPWTLLGLSLAGYNALIAGALALVALGVAVKGRTAG